MEKNKQTIYPGSVFTARHYDQFTKKFTSHPFVCVYNQALDDLMDKETNIIGLLITSNNKQAIRQVEISKSKNQFLDNDSYCYCNNIYTFDRKDIKLIGQIDSDTFFQIVKKRQAIIRGENDQCVQALMNMRGYESKKEVQKRNEIKKKKTISIKPKKKKEKTKLTIKPKKENKLQVQASYFPNFENTQTKSLPNRRNNISLISNHKETLQEKIERENFSFEVNPDVSNIKPIKKKAKRKK